MVCVGSCDMYMYIYNFYDKRPNTLKFKNVSGPPA